MTDALRAAAGLEWRFDGDAWNAADSRGRYQAVEYRAGVWTALYFPSVPACGCGRGALGGRDYPAFAEAAAAAAALATSEPSSPSVRTGSSSTRR